MTAILAAIAFTGLLPAQSGEIVPEWEVRKAMEELKVQVQHLEPVLAQVKPQEWVNRGAPEAWLKQWKYCQDELKYVQAAADNLARRPERLSVALDVHFRLTSLYTMVYALADGVRRYQNPAVAELVIAAANESSINREKLQKYITDLAISREKEFQIMDSEAQRCRANLSVQPPPAPARRQKSSESKAVQK